MRKLHLSEQVVKDLDDAVEDIEKAKVTTELLSKTINVLGKCGVKSSISGFGCLMRNNCTKR